MKYFETAMRGLIFGLSLLFGAVIAQNVTSSLQLSQDPRGNFGVTSAGDLLFQNQAHLNANAVSLPPAVSSCTGGTLVAGSTDFSGGVTGVTGTACTITFGRAYANAPNCLVNASNATAASTFATTSTTQLVMGFTTASSAKITWICVGNIN